jgi:hypothetical protein
MQNEEDIKQQITEITKNYQHVLNCYPATIQINAPRAMMQSAAITKLDTLYKILGETRPKFKCDDFTKTNY